MWPESTETKQPLRSGYTTGACATACAVAAAHCLFTGEQPDSVGIELPKGKRLTLPIVHYTQVIKKGDSISVTTTTIKDAGDDPDVTHGAKVFVQLTLLHFQTGEIIFKAAEGVGTVTRAGLLLPVGEPAINPVPRQMISQHLQQLAKRYHYSGGFCVAIGIENGEQIAKKTMNGRLGIVGGLSVLGTTGIVRPFSCSAWIASIHQGIDVAKANGIEHLAASTGNSSEAAIKTHYDLPEQALIEMGDFVGAVLKHLKNSPVKKLSICGGFGKITKLANGHLDLNSRSSAINFHQLAMVAKQAGASSALQERIVSANTSIEVLDLCLAEHIDIATSLCQQALQVARQIAPSAVQLEIWTINRQGAMIAHAF